MLPTSNIQIKIKIARHKHISQTNHVLLPKNTKANEHTNENKHKRKETTGNDIKRTNIQRNIRKRKKTSENNRKQNENVC